MEYEPDNIEISLPTRWTWVVRSWEGLFKPVFDLLDVKDIVNCEIVFKPYIGYWDIGQWSEFHKITTIWNTTIHQQLNSKVILTDSRQIKSVQFDVPYNYKDESKICSRYTKPLGRSITDIISCSFSFGIRPRQLVSTFDIDKNGYCYVVRKHLGYSKRTTITIKSIIRFYQEDEIELYG